MNEHVIEIDDEQFEQAVPGSAGPAVVDLWAEWCGPCRAIAPAFAALATEYAGRVRFFKVNVDDYPEVAQRFGVMSIPTLLFFENGREVERHVGSIGKDALARILDKYAPVGV